MAQLSLLIDTHNPHAVMEEVKAIVRMIYPDFDFDLIDREFANVVKLFRGEYPGYKACNTLYHDLSHTMDALLCLTRIIHGAHEGGYPFSACDIKWAIITTLMHDTGYIQKKNEDSGTGARHTLVHVQRSIDFMEKHFNHGNVSPEIFENCRDMLNCTGLNTKIEEIEFSSPEIKLLGKILGTADLLGQMADRHYLEKLLFLYTEFQEAGLTQFADELDLLKKTIDFYNLTQQRLVRDLDDVARFLPLHFRKRYGVEADLYRETIEHNMQYLSKILKFNPENYRRMLRRGGIVGRVDSARR